MVPFEFWAQHLCSTSSPKWQLSILFTGTMHLSQTDASCVTVGYGHLAWTTHLMSCVISIPFRGAFISSTSPFQAPDEPFTYVLVVGPAVLSGLVVSISIVETC